MDQWLVRTTENQIIGPCTKDQLVAMIREGALTIDDEVCSANNYWFFLHERDEVIGQIGIELPKQMYDQTNEEPTESLTVEIAEESTDPDVSGIKLQEGVEGDATSTTVLSTEALRKKFNKKAVATPRRVVDPGQFHSPVVVSQVERTPIWAWLAWLLLGVAGFLVFYVLRLLSVRQGGA
jgi:hypothetical protein